MDDYAQDLAQITTLVYEYASLLDGGDLDGVAALFDQATWRSTEGGTVLRGAHQVRRVYSRVQLYDGTPRTKHLITNLSIDLQPGADTAAAQCYFTVLQGIVRGEPIQVILSGRYVDRFERSDDGWRFADRLFVADLIGDQSRHFT